MAGSASGEKARQEHPEPFRTAFACIWMFLVCNAIVLGTLVAITVLGGAPSVFMWVRAVILLAVSPVLMRTARRAGAGAETMARRLRVVSTVLPVAVVAVDLVPGVAPIWYAAMQGVAALALVPVAVMSWRRAAGRAGT